MGNADHAGGAGTAAGAQPGQGMTPPSAGATRHGAGGCGPSPCRTARQRRWHALGCVLAAAGLLLALGAPAAHAEVPHSYSTIKSTNGPGLRC